MLVDAHTLFSSALKILLEKQDNIRVIGELTCVEEALQFLQEKNVDIIVMEINSEGMDSFEAIGYIKENYPQVKIIILTMYDDENHMFRALKAGVNGYILKEDNENMLVYAISSVSNGEVFISPSKMQLLVERTLDNREPKEYKEGQNNTILTKREEEVLLYITLGYTNQEIAEKIFVTTKTVEKHKNNIMKKLDLHRRYELVQYAISNGLVVKDYLWEIEHGPFNFPEM